MNFFDRLKASIETKNLTMAELERLAGFGNGTIRRWGNISPSIDKVILIANLLEVDIAWLLTGEKSKLEDDEDILLKQYSKLSKMDKAKVKAFIEISLISIFKEDTSTSKNLIEDNTEEYSTNRTVYNYRFFKPTLEPTEEDDVPYVGSVAAGTPNLYYYDSPEYISAPVSCDFAMTANGDSMYPVIHEEDYIFVKSTPFLENGDIGIISIDGETTCKKFYLRKNHIVLKSLNPNYEPMHYTIKEFSDIRIMGKVVLTQEQQERLTHLGMH